MTLALQTTADFTLTKLLSNIENTMLKISGWQSVILFMITARTQGSWDRIKKIDYKIFASKQLEGKW